MHVMYAEQEDANELVPSEPMSRSSLKHHKADQASMGLGEIRKTTTV